MNGYSELSPTSRAALDQRLKTLHDIIRRKKGSLHTDDDELVIVKNVFKEIPVFKDIPSNFKLEVMQSSHLMFLAGKLP
jgi:hypothetical protein